MKLILFLSLVQILLTNFFSSTSISGADWSTVDTNRIGKDSKTSFLVLKINPIQPAFCEIPVSFEIFRTPRKSLQFQVGYIFPRTGSMLNQTLFSQMGEEGMATNKGLFSYRNSPYNNDAGINLKMEIRFYSKEIGSTAKPGFFKSFYFGPQFLYKYCFYENLSFQLHDYGYYYYQTESKYSAIFGIGVMAGKQSVKNRFVADWYAGGGLRFRNMDIKIHEIYNPYPIPGTSTYPDTGKTEAALYPFINLGVRFGIRL